MHWNASVYQGIVEGRVEEVLRPRLFRCWRRRWRWHRHSNWPELRPEGAVGAHWSRAAAVGAAAAAVEPPASKGSLAVGAAAAAAAAVGVAAAGWVRAAEEHRGWAELLDTIVQWRLWPEQASRLWRKEVEPLPTRCSAWASRWSTSPSPEWSSPTTKQCWGWAEGWRWPERWRHCAAKRSAATAATAPTPAAAVSWSTCCSRWWIAGWPPPSTLAHCLPDGDALGQMTAPLRRCRSGAWPSGDLWRGRPMALLLSWSSMLRDVVDVVDVGGVEGVEAVRLWGRQDPMLRRSWPQLDGIGAIDGDCWAPGQQTEMEFNWIQLNLCRRFSWLWLFMIYEVIFIDLSWLISCKLI